MRLIDFILGNIESILKEWESFARSIWPGPKTDPLALRDHAEDILRATVRDMQSFQTGVEQSDKSKGDGPAGGASARIDRASDVHAIGRVRSGFDLVAVVAEYRALRASVIRLWRESSPSTDLCDLDDLTRFNESIDQSLAEAVRSYTQRVDESRRMFLAILGHDLRNPLNSMTMSAESLMETEQLDAESRQCAAQISSSAHAMGRMIGDLLDFTGARLGAGMPIVRASMDLGVLCREVVDEVRAGNPDQTVHCKLHGDLTGQWDTGRLRQVVSNLLGNAIQHGTATAPVELSVRGDVFDVELAVRNQGEPIPPEAFATIFDPLVRGSSAQAQKQRRAGSIGLGLYIAREIVTAHRGAIDVQSSREAGTVLSVRLPRVE